MPKLNRYLKIAALTAAVAGPLAAPAQDGPFKFYQFKCKGIERSKEQMFRTVQTQSGETRREFKCVDRSCFHWSVDEPDTENETDLIEHVFIQDDKRSYVLSWMVKRRGAEKPTYTYSRVKQFLECEAPPD